MQKALHNSYNVTVTSKGALEADRSSKLKTESEFFRNDLDDDNQDGNESNRIKDHSNLSGTTSFEFESKILQNNY